MIGVFRALALLDYWGNWSQYSPECPDLSNLKNPILLMNSTLVNVKAEPVAVKPLWNSVSCGLHEGLEWYSLGFQPSLLCRLFETTLISSVEALVPNLVSGIL